MDPDPSISVDFSIELLLTSLPVMLVLLALILASALISGSEVAFFSLQASDLAEMEDEKHSRDKAVLELLDAPKKLLATILIVNNLVNIGIVIISSYLIGVHVDFGGNSLAEFIVQVVGITFLLLLFGEVLPKVYASRNSLSFSRRMVPFISVVTWFFSPISILMVKSGSFFDGRFKPVKGRNLSLDDLSQALEITHEPISDGDEQKLLEGIVKFGNTAVKQIMTPRIDVVALESQASFDVVLECIRDSGYSRIPVFNDTFDQMTGILHIKDLLPHVDAQNDFDWKALLRKPFFVPELKKIDDLLQEFRTKRSHMAIVVDEFGGTSGIVTLEDVIEEIVGDISDEFDDDQVAYSKLDDYNYVFEGKTSLKDFYKILEIDENTFEEAKGEAETLAGFIIELSGKLPDLNDIVDFNKYRFTVEALDKRRIQRVKVSISPDAPYLLADD